MLESADHVIALEPDWSLLESFKLGVVGRHNDDKGCSLKLGRSLVKAAMKIQ